MWDKEYADLRCPEHFLKDEPEATHKLVWKGDSIPTLDNTLKRYVFYQTTYEPDEVRKLEKVKKKLMDQKIQIPLWWREGDSLRFLYEHNMKAKATFKVLITIIKKLTSGYGG